MVDVVDNTQNCRFEAMIGSELAGQIDYVVGGEVITYTHTGVPAEFEGKGIASALAQFALDQARLRGQSVVPQCPFVAEYINRHPQYADLLA
ncbi:MAG: GNAT family N-acetyltransferase [Candidatus Nanopelagicales bacterium]